MKSLASVLCFTLLGLTRIAVAAEEVLTPYEFAASSFLGEVGFDDAVVGACIQADGSLVLAANLGSDVFQKLGGKDAVGSGCVVGLSPDGTQVRFAVSVASQVYDLANNAQGQLYLAGGEDGLIKLSPDGKKKLWTAALGKVLRTDAGDDGHCAAIVESTVHILDADGKTLGTAEGGQFTCDVCVDSKSRTVIQTGFRNAHAFDGKKNYPVQISYIRGHAYDGQRKWVNYDWSTDRDSDRFLNKPTNNMADSRGDRCAVGRDGKLYVTFQVAGGNHIFRYSPRDIMQPVELAGGDKYHQFYNSRSEHKCFFGRYEPATGDFLAGQQFCGRLSSGGANAVVTKTGDITADEEGRVYVVGQSAYGIPLTLNPTGGEYLGGGFILVMSPDLKQRLLVTRTLDGKGSPHAVDVRSVDGRRRAVYAGSGMIEGMFVKNAVQPTAGDKSGEKDDPQDGFVVVLQEK